MVINMSKSLLLLLLFSMIASIVLLLEPKLPAHIEQISGDRHLTVAEKNKTLGNEKIQDLTIENNWIRRMEPAPVLEKKVRDDKSTQVPTPHVVEYISPQPVVEVNPQPVVPTPQYAYVGRLIDGNKESLFLLSPTGAVVVKTGEILDGEWLVKQATDISLDLTYLPLNITYRLMLK